MAFLWSIGMGLSQTASELERNTGIRRQRRTVIRDKVKEATGVQASR
jgi:hypothetical protein